MSPLLFLSIAFIGAATLGVQTAMQESDGARGATSARAIAEQMAVYHVRTMRQCPTHGACPPGEVVISTPDLTPHDPSYYSQRFLSLSDGGGQVITVLRNPNAPQWQNTRSLVAENLGALSRGSANAGSWRASIPGIMPAHRTVRMDSHTVTLNSTMNIPIGFVGRTMVDGEPIIASRN